MREKRCGRYFGLLFIAMLFAMPVIPVMVVGSETELLEITDSAQSFAHFSPQENIEGFDQGSQTRCTVPEALTDVRGLSIDPALVSATPYWIYLAAGKKEQLGLINYIRKSDAPSKKKDEWIQFLQATWKKYPLKFLKQGSSASLITSKPVREYSLTKKENTTFAEIDKMITADMENTAKQEIVVQWAPLQHVDFITIAMKTENLPDAVKGIANQSAPLPDEWYPWDPTGVLSRSINHGYLITQYAPTVEGQGFAPQNTGTYALSAKTKYLLHDYNGAFTDLGYSSHFISDLGQPYHTPNLILAIWPSYDDPFSTESKIVRYKTLHDQYEGFVLRYWSQQTLPNGRTFSDYANSATGATIVIEPTTSAKYHAVASNVANVPLYYLCSWHYLFNRNYNFQNNPAIVALTGERVIATTENTRGLVRFVTGGQAPILTITASAGEHGNITPSGSSTINYGDTPTFTIKEDPGYIIEEVKVDGESKGAITSHTFEPVISDHTISATFKQIPTNTIGVGKPGVFLTAADLRRSQVPSDFIIDCTDVPVSWDGTGSVILYNDSWVYSPRMGADDQLVVTTKDGSLTFTGYQYIGQPDITSIMHPGTNYISLQTNDFIYTSVGLNVDVWIKAISKTAAESTAYQTAKIPDNITVVYGRIQPVTTMNMSGISMN